MGVSKKTFTKIINKFFIKSLNNSIKSINQLLNRVSNTISIISNSQKRICRLIKLRNLLFKRSKMLNKFLIKVKYPPRIQQVLQPFSTRQMSMRRMPRQLSSIRPHCQVFLKLSSGKTLSLGKDRSKHQVGGTLRLAADELQKWQRLLQPIP